MCACVCMLVDLESVFLIHIPDEVWDPLLNINITNDWGHEPTHLWLIPSVAPLHWRVTFSLDQITGISIVHYFTFLLPVGSFGYSGCYLLIFPATSSITYFPDKSSTIIGPGRVEFPYTVSLYCSMLGFLNLGSFDIWGWIALCCGGLSCLLMNVSSILGSTHEMPVAAPELCEPEMCSGTTRCLLGAKL